LKINIEKLVEIITNEVVEQLTKLGVEIDYSSIKERKIISGNNRKNLNEIINLKNYKTPVLTINQLNSLGEDILEIEVPRGTIITPGARDIIKKRNLRISSNYKTN
jgi:ethanolamine utilization cobalamin adenosyltransferase